MKCPKCGGENSQARKFCGACGAPLILPCPECGFENLPTDQFCGGCGLALDDSSQKKPSLASERKTVTVLFSDLSGYTAMSEKLDPEEVKEITTRIFGLVAHIVSRHEGLVEKYIGDAVVAFFGVPRHMKMITCGR